MPTPRALKIFVLFAFAAFAVVVFSGRSEVSQANGRYSNGSIDAPTGVRSTVNLYATKVGVYWDTVRGATLYRIYRNTANDPNSATDVGTSSGNYYFDQTAVAGQSYFYWVRAENSVTSSSFSEPASGRRANGNVFPGPFPPLDPPPSPSGNSVTAAKASLGKALFWDEQLSSTNTVSCGTCHRPEAGGRDPRTLFGNAASRNPGPDGTPNTFDDVFGSPGVPKNNADGTYADSPLFAFRPQVTKRRSPSYLNAGYTPNGLFWDGRATGEFRDPLTNEVLIAAGASLESQVLGPPVSDIEMAHGGRDWPQVATRIAAAKPLMLAEDVPNSLRNWIGGRSYPELFDEAFGTPEVTPARIAMAIATHERQLFSDQTPLDRWGASIEQLTPQEMNGLSLFVNKRCIDCHTGSLLADNEFHNIGVRPQFEDRGRGAITNNPADDGAFRTPTLRNVELRGPYMRNGQFQTLEEVVEFYNRGGDHDAPNIDRQLIRNLQMTSQEKANLVAFMKRPMTDIRVRDELPPFDRPKLYTESNRVPTVVGEGRQGLGGKVPKAIALEPPFLGNSSFTVAVEDGNPGAQARLVLDDRDPGIALSMPVSGSLGSEITTLNANGRGSISFPISNDQSLVNRVFYGRWYVTDPNAQHGFSVSRRITFRIFGDQPLRRAAAFVDMDGDRRTDISIYRRSASQWWYLRSSDDQNRAFEFGSESVKLVPGDFTGDGKTDLATWDPSAGVWSVLRSDDLTYYAFGWGQAGDIPAVGDFDGDGIHDHGIFRSANATWYILRSSGGAIFKQFGTAGDIPQIGDFDGDGIDDLAVFRPNGADGAEWWIEGSSDGIFATQFGLASDKPVAADFTGDGKTDVAFYRPETGVWYILRSEDLSFYAAPWGAEGDIPAPGDYDGDGKADLAIFRPSTGTWYINRSTSGIGIYNFGINGDEPVPGYRIP